MRSLSFALTVLLSAMSPVFADDVGRYQVSVNENTALLVDTKTGRTWMLVKAHPEKKAMTEQPYEWRPLGFANPDAPPPRPK